MPTLVSACLLGFPCRHDSADKRSERVLDALRDAEIVPICPEVAGGLGIPRPPAWQVDGRVIDALGADVTAQFEDRARERRLAAAGRTPYAPAPAPAFRSGRRARRAGPLRRSAAAGLGSAGRVPDPRREAPPFAPARPGPAPVRAAPRAV